MGVDFSKLIDKYIVSITISGREARERVGGHVVNLRDETAGPEFVRFQYTTALTVLRRLQGFCPGSDEGSHLRLIDFCITHSLRLESNKEERRRSPVSKAD